jgi:hypothetical protein
MSELRVDKIVNTVGSGSVEFTQGITIPSGQTLVGTAQTAESLSTTASVNTSGIITATTFSGNLVGTATSTTNIPNLSGDVTSNNKSTTLATVNSNVGTFGSSSAIPSITVNAKGLVTGVSTSSIAVGDGTLTLNVSGTGLSGSQTFSANQSGNTTFTVTSNSTSNNTPSTIVSRDASGNFSAGTITATSAIISGNVSIAGTLTYEDVTNIDSIGIITARSGIVVNSGGINVTGVATATSFSGSGVNLTGIVTSIVAGTNITISGSTGQVTIDAASGGGGGGSGEFNTGITSSVQLTPLAYETTVFTFPSTAGQQYVIETINVANVDTSVGVGTTVNIIASIQDSTGEQTYIAYNVPVSNGGLIELLKNPMVAGPSDVIKMWSLNENYSGVSNALEVYMNYGGSTSTEYTRKFASTVSIASTNVIGIYTATSYPSVIESIHITNRTDTGDYPISVSITNGVTTTYLAKDLIIPRYSVVDILDRPKRVELNGIINVQVQQTSTIDVIIAGKQITT